MDKKLYRIDRTCCICKRCERNGAKGADRLNIIAISPLVYRRGGDKGRIRNAGRVQICEECFVRLLSFNPPASYVSAAWNSIAERLRGCYSAMNAES